MAQADEPRGAPELEGIGGWLILPLIQLIFTPLYLIWLVVQRLPEVAARVPAHAQGAQIAVVLFTLPFFAALIFCLVRFLQKRRAVPWLMTLFYGLNIAGLVLIIAHLIKGVGFTDANADQSLVAWRGVRATIEIAVSVVWIFYFHNSVRVANTFKAIGRSRERKPERAGLGGWLIPPLVVLSLWNTMLLIGFVRVLPTLPGKLAFSLVHHTYAPARWLAGFAVIAASLALLVLFLKKKRLARWLMMVFFAVLLGLFLAFYFTNPTTPPHKWIAHTAIICALCLAIIAYFTVSKRVRATFVR